MTAFSSAYGVKEFNEYLPMIMLLLRMAGTIYPATSFKQ